MEMTQDKTDTIAEIVAECIFAIHSEIGKEERTFADLLIEEAEQIGLHSFNHSVKQGILVADDWDEFKGIFGQSIIEEVQASIGMVKNHA